MPNEVAAWRLHDEELVRHLESKNLWVLGVQVVVGDRFFALLAHLAKEPTRFHPAKDVGALLAKGSSTPDVAACKAKGDAERCVRDALESAGSIRRSSRG